MSHSHARHSDSRHGHSWSTWGYSKTHSADYKSAALPLELQVQSCWSRQQGFNPHPSPYRGDTLALSYFWCYTKKYKGAPIIGTLMLIDITISLAHAISTRS